MFKVIRKLRQMFRLRRYFRLVFHPVTAVKIGWRTFVDSRVSGRRRFMFIAALLAFIAVLCGVDFIPAIVLNVFGIPVDAGLDLATFALVLPNLIALALPSAVFQEKYDDVFSKKHRGESDI